MLVHSTFKRELAFDKQHIVHEQTCTMKYKKKNVFLFIISSYGQFFFKYVSNKKEMKGNNLKNINFQILILSILIQIIKIINIINISKFAAL